MLAKDDEIRHIFSGETPNGFDFLYEQFNKTILGGKGELKDTKPGLHFGNFTGMKTVHNAAHGSFQSLITWVSAKVHPEFAAYFPNKYIGHLEKYEEYLEHVGNLFTAGKAKTVILTALQNMHTNIQSP